MKKKVILSSIMTIVLCLSLIAGSTYALFTSGETVNVAVTSGKVEVVATVNEISHGSTIGANVPETVFSSTEDANGVNTITIDLMVPGDYYEFDVVVKNNSNVTIDFATIISVVSDTGLWSGLEVSFDGVVATADTNGNISASSSVQDLAPGADPAVVRVRISLPEDRGNQYQDKSCTIAYTVSAIQGNAQ